MITSLKPTTIDYTSILDDDKTVTFKLGTIDSLLKLHIQKQLNLELKKEGIVLNDILSSGDIEDVTVKYIIFTYYCTYGLKGWEGLKDSDGNDVQFELEEVNIPFIGKRKLAKQDSLLKLDSAMLIELGSKILELNYISNVEKKS